MPDIVVVGGGPAGSMSAALLAKHHDVVVLEDHAESGTPLQCTGLVSPDVVRMSGVKPTVLNSFSKLNVHFPDGFVYSVDCKSERAVLLDRSGLDRQLAESAMDAGAEFLYSERCRSCKVSSDSVNIKTESGKTFDARIVIGADGHNSIIRRSVCSDPPRMQVRGIQMDVRHTFEDQDAIDVWLGSDVAPGFFAWTIPYEDTVRVGLCSEWSCGLPADHLPNLLRKAGLSDSKVIHKSCGKIPIGLQRRSYSDRILLLGDSAGQVKPISGGGLYPMMASVPHLVGTVEEAFAKGDFSARALSKYQRLWKKEVGSELKNGFTLRRMYNNLRDDELNEIRRIVDTPFVHNLAESATIDSPSSMVLKALRNVPMAVRLAPYLFKGLFR
ncbi:MAG: NAD(P)/FAD-dependent oxidoreductase [Candidatus Methanomethylophilaceae archaeon]|nr:NAD(P)/FAD-dependent oxidoreductase [Candidatus Methanomethylophilaceae archaeon]